LIGDPFLEARANLLVTEFGGPAVGMVHDDDVAEPHQEVDDENGAKGLFSVASSVADNDDLWCGHMLVGDGEGSIMERTYLQGGD
jgi:hypothetical protein